MNRTVALASPRPNARARAAVLLRDAQPRTTLPLADVLLAAVEAEAGLRQPDSGLFGPPQTRLDPRDAHASPAHSEPATSDQAIVSLGLGAEMERLLDEVDQVRSP
jgi:hypothetical protein